MFREEEEEEEEDNENEEGTKYESQIKYIPLAIPKTTNNIKRTITNWLKTVQHRKYMLSN